MTLPPRNRRNAPSEQADEAAGLIESEQVDVEREIPVDHDQPVERIAPPEPPGPPAFED
jgi:hypothetical protein